MNYEEKIKQVALFNEWAEFEGFDTRMCGEYEHSDKETHCAFLGWMAFIKKLEGCVVVPVEPTEGMVHAFEKGMLESEHFFGEFEAFNDGYKAMVEAARGGNHE